MTEEIREFADNKAQIYWLVMMGGYAGMALCGMLGWLVTGSISRLVAPISISVAAWTVVTFFGASRIVRRITIDTKGLRLFNLFDRRVGEGPWSSVHFIERSNGDVIIRFGRRIGRRVHKEFPGKADLVDCLRDRALIQTVPWYHADIPTLRVPGIVWIAIVAAVWCMLLLIL